MRYRVKEIYHTLQGEGAQAGRAAVFCRFSGCNLWSGREEERQGARCAFCDTDFVGTDGPGGGTFQSPRALADAIAVVWERETEGAREGRFVVCTGGEPLLQLDLPLIEALHAEGFEIAVETNGTRLPPPGIDWLCVSPKAGTTLRCRAGEELKLIYPQPGAEPECFLDLDFDHFFLQPMDGPAVEENTRLAIDYCRKHPRWRLSLQRHKLLRIP
ncbi:MAG: 7-carboxy-7-deazaguanine synthase [Deltaproteobacteria bacterium]|nr:MAG: 7-carboxy-7-deazaguanine synthase [Deltaproteobacteria bacterium]